MSSNPTGPGTLVELDLQDSLGWIELDTGERVRIGGTVLVTAFDHASLGARVRVV